MGFLKDIRSLKQQADAMTPPEYRGLGGGLRQMRDGVANAGQMMGDMQQQAFTAQHLMANGIVGQATITALRDTGTSVNDNPQVELDLLVTLPGGTPYPVTHRQVISRIAVGGFQPGATVPVRVDPANGQSLIIA